MARKKYLDSTAIYLFLGNKGGVGKSGAAKAMAEYQKETHGSVEIIDADTGNPDVAKAFGVELTYNLNETNGFLDLANRLATVAIKTPVVISTPAGFIERAQQHGEMFFQMLPSLPEMLGRDVRVIWMLDDKRDAVESLKEFMSLAPNVRVDVFRNLHFASANRFNVFNESKTRLAVLESGGIVVDFPALAGRVMAVLTNRRLTVSQALQELPFGDRFELVRWWTLVGDAFRAGGYI